MRRFPALAAAGVLITTSGVSGATSQLPLPHIVRGPAFETAYVTLGLRDAEALLYRPELSNDSGIALVYVHPSGNAFTEPLGPQMASRGFPTLMVNRHGDGADRDDLFGPAISQTVRYARSLPGIATVVLVGHSGGGHLATFYQNVAENGPNACSGPEKIYACDRAAVADLAKPDGLVLLDPTLGSFHQANSLDPAVSQHGRDGLLDMFAEQNGYDVRTGAATYSLAFRKRFDTAQAVRSSDLTREALARLDLIRTGHGRFSDDEPLVISGMGNLASGARLFQPDRTIMAHTRGRYITLRSDGTATIGQITSIRPPIDSGSAASLGTLEQMTRNTTVRTYLATSAIRFEPNFAITADDIRGIDWASGLTSTPGNAEGVKAPTLILSMSCHYLVVPGEVIYERLGAKDKTLMAIEGATHVFKPCRPEFGDTVARTFDAIAGWLKRRDRFK